MRVGLENFRSTLNTVPARERVPRRREAKLGGDRWVGDGASTSHVSRKTAPLEAKGGHAGVALRAAADREARASRAPRRSEMQDVEQEGSLMTGRCRRTGIGFDPERRMFHLDSPGMSYA